jgi:glycosyltransferase involved in cell wall biosynthesis
MPTGNGAYIVHEQLASCIDGYSIASYHPNFTLFPPILPLLGCNKTDVIHTTPDYGIFFKKRNSKLVLTFHNYVLDPFMQDYSSLLQKIHYRTDLRYFTRLSLKQADILTAVSYFTADLVKQDMGLNQEIRVIYNGIDESVFVPAKSKKIDTSISLLFSGNASRRKGFDFLPKLLPLLNGNIKILYTAGLRNRRPSRGSDRMIDIGCVPHGEMARLYQQADILIFPSIREGFGLSVAEAMSCGLPIVAFNTSSLPELVDHESGGYLTDIYDVRTFADYINTLAESPALRTQMGEYNRVKVEEKFTQSRMVEDYRLLFEEVLAL